MKVFPSRARRSASTTEGPGSCLSPAPITRSSTGSARSLLRHSIAALIAIGAKSDGHQVVLLQLFVYFGQKRRLELVPLLNLHRQRVIRLVINIHGLRGYGAIAALYDPQRCNNAGICLLESNVPFRDCRVSGQNSVDLGFHFRQTDREGCAPNLRLLLKSSELFLNFLNFGSDLPTAQYFQKYLLTEQVLLFEFVGSRCRARIHLDS